MTNFRKKPLKNLAWALMTLFAFAITIAFVTPYLSLNPANFNNASARYAAETPIKVAGLFVHAFSSALALLIGPFQFLDSLRKRRPKMHRLMGRLYLIFVLAGGVSAFIIAPGIMSGLVGEVGLSMLAGLWLYTGYKAYSEIRQRKVEAHRQWMIRNYALTFAAVTLRVWLGILIATQLPLLNSVYVGKFDLLFVEVYRVVMWLCWVPNLILAEWLIHRRQASQIELTPKPQISANIG